MLDEAIEATNKSSKLSKDEAPSTFGESTDSLLGDKGSKTQKKSIDISFIKNVGFVNEKWTEIPVEDEEESDKMDREEIKRAIIQMTKIEEHYPLDNWIDKFIRVNHKTYVPVEVVKDRNGRTMYTPLIPTEKPKISFGAEIRTPANPIARVKSQTKSSRLNIHV